MSETPSHRPLTAVERQSIRALQGDQSDKQLHLTTAQSVLAIEATHLQASVATHLKRLQKDTLISLMARDGMVIPTADLPGWGLRIQRVLAIPIAPTTIQEPFVRLKYQDARTIVVEGIRTDATPWIDTLEYTVAIPPVLLPWNPLILEEAIQTTETHNKMRGALPEVQVVPVVDRTDLQITPRLSTPILYPNTSAQWVTRSLSARPEASTGTPSLPGLPEVRTLSSMSHAAELADDPIIAYYLKRRDKRENAERETAKNTARFFTRIQSVCTILETSYPSQEWARLVAWLRERLNGGTVQDIVQVQKFLGIVSHAKYHIDGVFGWRTMRLLEKLPQRITSDALPTLVAQLGLEGAPSQVA